MKITLSLILSIFLITVTSFSHASTAISANNLTITGMSTHDQGDQSNTYIKFSDGTYAYINGDQNGQKSLALSAYMAGKKVSYIYYTNTSLNYSFWLGGGVLGHGTPSAVRIHRIDIAN